MYFASLCKNQKKTNEPIPKKDNSRGTNEQTNGQLDKGEFIGPPSRSKKQVILNQMNEKDRFLNYRFIFEFFNYCNFADLSDGIFFTTVSAKK